VTNLDIDGFLKAAHERLRADAYRKYLRTPAAHRLTKSIGDAFDTAEYVANRKQMIERGHVFAVDVQTIAGRKVTVHHVVQLPDATSAPDPDLHLEEEYYIAMADQPRHPDTGQFVSPGPMQNPPAAQIPQPNTASPHAHRTGPLDQFVTSLRRDRGTDN
jgi:hypothetical protein